MGLSRIALVVIWTALLAGVLSCGGGQVGPTPDLDATVEARAKGLVAGQATPLPPASTVNLDATSEAKVAAAVIAASVQPTLQPTAVSAKKPCTLTGGEGRPG